MSDRLARLVFIAGMPVVLGFGALSVDFSGLGDATYLLAGVVASLLVTGLAFGWGSWRGMPRDERAVFVQGAFRSNLGIIGIALCVDAHGQTGLVLASLPVALLTILYNVIAVPLLMSGSGRRATPLRVLVDIIRNPLIIGISAGGVLSIAGWSPASPIQAFGEGLSRVVLPLALVSIGASLDLRLLRRTGIITLETTAWRLLLAPLLAVMVALVMGVQGVELEVFYLLLATPVAAASFVMVVAAGGPGPLAANMVVVSTALSALTLPLGLVLLRLLA